MNKLIPYIVKLIDIKHSLPFQIDITNACNLQCKHCYHAHHLNTGSLSLADWHQIIEQYFNLIQEFKYKPEIIICGGEPLVSPNLIPIVEYVLKKDSSTNIIILSNGTNVKVLKNEIFKGLSNLKVQISLDGPTASIHDEVRGANSFAKTLNGIAELKDLGIETSLLAVLSKRTSVWIEDFFKLAKQLEVHSFSFTRIIAQGQAKGLIDSGLDSGLRSLALKKAYQQVLINAGKYGVKTSTKGPLWHLIHPALGSNGNFWEAIIVDYQGYLLASSRSRIRLGKVTKNNLKDLFMNNPLSQKQRRAKVQVCGSCTYYKFCGGDRNVAFAESGDFLGADPGCWIKKN